MNMKKRIQILLVFLVGLPLALLLFETYRTGRRTLLEEIRKEAVQTALLQAAMLERVFENPRLAAEGIVRAQDGPRPLEPDEVRDLLKRTLEQTPDAYGMAVAVPSGPSGPFIPYVFRQRQGMVETSLTNPSYNYAAQDWYAQPMARNQPVWSHPYLDRGGGEVPMITYAAPIRRNGRTIGVATADVALDSVVDRLRRLKPGGGGHAYLVNRDGAVLAHPQLKPLDDPATEVGIPRLGELRGMLDRAGMDSVETKDPFTGTLAWLVEVPLENLQASRGGRDWSLVVSWPTERRLRPLADLGKRFIVLYLALGGAALLFLNRSLNDMISRPISRLAKQARRFCEGDFRDLGHPPPEAVELKELSHAVQLMGVALKGKEPKTEASPGASAPQSGEQA